MKIPQIPVNSNPPMIGNSLVHFFKKIFTEIGYARVSARDAINLDSPWLSGSGILFATINAHSFMIKFMFFSIKYLPSISLRMVKFVCYRVPSNNTSELLTHISTVKYLQCSDQINLAK